MSLRILLVRELRSRARNEYFAWVIFAYLMVLGIIGLGFLLRVDAITPGYQIHLLRQIGSQLFAALALVQLFLLAGIAPVLTATTVNGERVEHTFDLLLCSKLSTFSLLIGKCTAALLNTLLLIALPVPLYSLVYFFGGIALAQVFAVLVVLLMTAVVIEVVGLLCSIVLRLPRVSMTITYAFCALWLFWYWVVYYLISQGIAGVPSASTPPANGLLRPLLVWSPIAALSSGVNNAPVTLDTVVLFRLHLAPWVAFALLSLIVTVVLFLVSMLFISPVALSRWLNQIHKQWQKWRPKAGVGSA